MLDFARTAALGTVAALALGLGAPAAEAVTVVVENGSYDISGSEVFIGDVTASGGAGSWEVRFNSLVDPLYGLANASVTNIVAGTFSNLVMSWVAVSDGFVLDSIVVTPPIVSLSTKFTTSGILGGDDIDQWLRFTWDNSLDGASFDFDVTISPIPLPAGGLLLIGALGGLAVLRRRKDKADS